MIVKTRTIDMNLSELKSARMVLRGFPPASPAPISFGFRAIFVNDRTKYPAHSP